MHVLVSFRNSWKCILWKIAWISNLFCIKINFLKPFFSMNCLQYPGIWDIVIFDLNGRKGNGGTTKWLVELVLCQWHMSHILPVVWLPDFRGYLYLWGGKYKPPRGSNQGEGTWHGSQHSHVLNIATESVVVIFGIRFTMSFSLLLYFNSFILFFLSFFLPTSVECWASTQAVYTGCAEEQGCVSGLVLPSD